jgi:DNA-binding NarL/FixJ family response regulator
MTIRVLIADDDKGIRDVLTDVLARESDLALVGVAGDADEAIDLARQHAPDVAILDVRMPKGGGKRAAAGIALASPRTSLIAFSAHDDETNVTDMLVRGTGQYLVKNAPTAEIVAAIRRAARKPGSSNS